AAQPADQRCEGRVGSERCDLALERRDPRVDEIEGVQVVVEGGLPRRLVEALLAEPAAAADAPRLRRHAPVIAQKQLAESVAGTHPLDSCVLARPDQITRRLELLRRDMDR